jgi:diguanylate cyclase (GGDEF)-like protein
MLEQAVLDVLICTAGGVVAVVLVWVAATWGTALFVAFVVAADLGYRAAVRAGQRYGDLERLYTFTQDLGHLREEQDVIAAVLEQARRLFSANRAELALCLGAPLEQLAVHCCLQGDAAPEFHDAAPAGSLGDLVAERGPLLFAPGGDDERLARAMAARGISEALVAPLQRDDPTAGYLLVADRAFKHEGFKLDDLRFFEALATNAGAALRASALLAELRDEAGVRQHEAQHDSLTGLPNRALLSERLERALSGPAERHVAVMLMDLDGFREVNDALGHDAGDAILAEIARRLDAFADETGLVARLGGDEFALLKEGTGSRAALLATAEEVLAAVMKPYHVGGLQLDVRASVGIAAAPTDGTEPGSLLRHADVAMYAAKGAGGGARLYDHAGDRSTLRRLRLATELRRALDARELDVWYQPAVDLRTGDVIGYEALVRWSHEQFGPIPPDEFIPVAESAGLINPLTWWVLEQALAQVKHWRELVPRLRMSVNLSARSLGSARLTDRVMEVLAGAELGAEVLTLELTESSMMVDPLGDRALRGLNDLGVSLSIDDFGTGYSSLSRLKRLPFQEVKIDKSFVMEMRHDSADYAVVRSTIELARNLHKRVIAEGVEDHATLQRLAALGCHAAQGFYLAKPMPPADCEAWLKATSRRPAALGLPGRASTRAGARASGRAGHRAGRRAGARLPDLSESRAAELSESRSADPS